MPSADEYVPGAQPWHVDEATAPNAVENCPAAHRLGQAAGKPNADEYVPAAQPRQVTDATAPETVEYWPAGHIAHAPALTIPEPDE